MDKNENVIHRSTGVCSVFMLLISLFTGSLGVLLVLCFQFHACFLLIGLPLCVRGGEVVLCIPVQTHSAPLRPKSIW